MKRIFVFLIGLVIFFLSFAGCSENAVESIGKSKISGQIIPPTSGQLILGEISAGTDVNVYNKAAIVEVPENGEYEFKDIKKGYYSFIFISDDYMPFVADTVLDLNVEGSYRGFTINIELHNFPKQIDTTFTLPLNSGLDTVITPIQIKVDELNPNGLACLSLNIKNEAPANAAFEFEFKYPEQQIAFGELLNVFEISIYKDTELYNHVILSDFKDPLNPGDSLIYQTYITIPFIDNSSVYKVRCRLWGNYE